MGMGYLINLRVTKPKPTIQPACVRFGDSAIVNQPGIEAHRGDTVSSGGLKYNAEREWGEWKKQSKEREPCSSMERLLD